MPHPKLVRACFLILALSLSACTNVTSDWWTFQRNAQRTGHMAGGIGPAPAPYWTAALVTGTLSLTPPVWGAIGDTLRIFIGSGDGRLFALSPYTGATIWTFAAPPSNALTGAPAAADSNVYFATRGTAPHVYAVTQRTGAVVWQMPLPGIGSTAAIALGDGIVYVNTDAHQLLAFSRYNGNHIWTANTSPGLTSQESAPSLAFNKVYVGSDDGLFAFDKVTGAQLWKYNLAAIPGFSAPVIDATSPALVFIGTNDFKVHAVDAHTGVNVWTYTGSATMAFSSVAAGGRRVFVFDGTNVKALDRGTGAVLWTQPVALHPRHSPVVAGRVLFYHDNANVHQLDAGNGSPVWQAALPGNGTANAPGNAMAVGLEMLLVPNKGHLHAFR